MNRKLLRQIMATILEEPRRLDMGQWLRRRSHCRDERDFFRWQRLSAIPKCGTVGCIAGWAINLTMPERVPEEFGPEWAANTAGAKLGLTAVQGARLFWVYKWPHDLTQALDATKPGTKEHALVVARRIRRFIRTNGRA